MSSSSIAARSSLRFCCTLSFFPSFSCPLLFSPSLPNSHRSPPLLLSLNKTMDSGPPWQQPDPLWGYGQLPLQARSADGGGGGGGGANGTGGILKRSFADMERQQNQQTSTHLLQQALLMRAVRQKTSSFMAPPLVMPSPVMTSPLISPSVFSGGSGLGSASVSSFSSASLNSSMNMYRNVMSMHPNNGSMMNSNPNSNLNMSMSMSMNGNSSSPAGFSFNPAPAAAAPVNDTVRNQLKELERQLLCDDDEEDEEPSGSGSVITNPDWSETIQQMLEMSTTPSPPAARQVPQLPVIGGGTAVQNQTLSSSPSNSSSSTASSSASYSPPVSATSSRQLLSDTATAIAEGNLESAFANIAALKRNVNLNGDTEQRLTGMMITSLTGRINALMTSQLPVGNPTAELCRPEQRAATQLLHDTSPCFKLGLLAANLAILGATKGYQLHLIDFDIGTGSQHARLIQALGEGRRNVVFKITVVSDPTSTFTAAASSNTALVGERLKKIAERAGVILSFNMVTCRISELDRLRLGCEPNETLAVNLAFVLSRVPDESVTPANPRDELLRRVRSLGPHVVTLVEHEMNGNTAPFATRFTEACGYYGAILDSLDMTFGRDTVERSRVEAALTRKAVNLVSKEGTERVERCELHGKWRARMSMAGLVPVPLSPSTADHLRARLNSVRHNHNHSFMVKEESGGIGFGYTGRILTMASAWR